MQKGFTLIEIIVTIAILIVVVGLISFRSANTFREESDLNKAALDIVSTLRLAQSRSLAAEQASKSGVYFSTSTSPYQYTLYLGSDYSSRAASSDELYDIPGNIEISSIDLAGENEVVFERITGITYQSGNIEIRLKNRPSRIKTIYVESSGKVSLTSSSISDEDRLKDSRHVHFAYSRFIATSTENLVLSFEGGVQEMINISDNILDDQIYWEGEVDVGGSVQELEIITHRLNNPDTLFSIHRDLRYNDKEVDIDIDGDPYYPGHTPILIHYDADGATTQGNSLYVSEPIWQ